MQTKNIVQIQNVIKKTLSPLKISAKRKHHLTGTVRIVNLAEKNMMLCIGEHKRTKILKENIGKATRAGEAAERELRNIKKQKKAKGL